MPHNIHFAEISPPRPRLAPREAPGNNCVRDGGAGLATAARRA